MKRRQQPQAHDEFLSVSLAGLKLRNPTMLASGFLGISQDIFNRLYNSGVGAVVSKSISINPIEGYRNPTIFSFEGGSYLNAVGLANPGAEAFSTEIANNKNVPIIVSLVGSSDKEFPIMIKKFNDLNIIGYEINLSCPHVAKMGIEVGDDPEMVSRIVKTIKSNTSKSVIVKIGVGTVDVVKTARVAKDAGADAITAINTIRAMSINLDTLMPVLSSRIGGLSGKSIKPVGVRCVYEIYKNLGIPVIGCGGIFTWEDAIEFMLAGASAVQLGSVIGYQGISIFRNITRGIKKYLERKGLKNAMEVVGLSHKY
ncbi:MAG: dihydroorotate dehydrogenase [Nitrososphaeraceae archaeon]